MTRHVTAPAAPLGGTPSRRALLRLGAGAGLALLAGCGTGSRDAGADEPWVTLRIGGDRGKPQKAKFGSGRRWIR